MSETIIEEVPLQLILDKRYMRLKSYLESFIEKVEQSGINPNDYVVVITVKEA